MSLITRISATLGLAPTPPAAQPGTPGAPPAGAAMPSVPLDGPTSGDTALVRIVSINDFHGQLGDSTSDVDGVPIGGAATLAAYVDRERAGNPGGTLMVSAGDAMGASPPESTLLRHESTMAVLHAMGMGVATFGNHEFDKGYAEAMRMIVGDAAAPPPGTGTAAGPTGKRRRRKAGVAARADAAKGASQLGRGWPGSPFAWVSANVVDKRTRKPVLPPYEIRELNGVKVAIIGATTADLKNVTMASGITNIEAIDPAAAINSYIPEIQAKGARAVVVIVHEGGEAAKDDPAKIDGPIVDLAHRLSPEVDAIVSAHSHKEYATTIAGKVVTQAGSYGKAIGSLDLHVDRKSGQVVAKTAKLVRNDERGIQPHAQVQSMVSGFERAVAPQTQRVVSVLPGAVMRDKSPAGETALGTLIAEAQREFSGADVAIMNPGGIRQDLPKGGPVTWGTLFGVQPFGNHIITMQLTGAEIMETLEQMFPSADKATMLQMSGMRAWFDASKPIGQKLTRVTMDDGSPLDPKRTYTLAANSFIAEGGDGFTTLKKGRKRKDVGVDLDALVRYLERGRPVPTTPVGKLTIVDGKLPSDSH